MTLQTHDRFASLVDHFARALLPDLAIRSLLLMGVVGVAVLALRRASAATRHWAWLLGFVGLLLLPLTSAALPGLRVLPRLGAHAAAERMSANMPLPKIIASSPPHTMATEPPPTGLSSFAEPRVAIARQTDMTWPGWIALAWVVGTALLLARLVLGYVGLWRLQRRCVRLSDGQWQDPLDRACRAVGVRRPVRLLADPRSVMPMTWGLWHAKLLLPAEAAGWEPARRDDVLLHELGHVRRFDCATQLLAQIACAAYWFNPLVWFAWHRLQVERERACDDIALNAGTAAAGYAQHLLECAASFPRLPFTMPALAMARPSTLEQRLRNILDSGRNRAALGRRSAGVMVCLLLFVLAPVAILHAQEPKPATRTPRTSLATRPTTRPNAAVPPPRPITARQDGEKPTMGQGPTCAFNATIYELRIPPDKIGQLDASTLTDAAITPAGFEKALADLGKSRAMYHADQSVRLVSDLIEFGTSVPITTNSQVTNRGQMVNTVRYQTVGASFSIAGKVAGPDKIDCDLKIELSAASEMQQKVGPGLTQPLFRRATMLHNGTARPKKPFVILSADAANTDADGKAVVYVAKVTFGTPE
jgi:beta-lactamase regulating signal transducer with metallopeptidase domain